ncbi:peptidase [Sesbania bispinosa]|nr:peptidase [Sesbania bispinosa]
MIAQRPQRRNPKNQNGINDKKGDNLEIENSKKVGVDIRNDKKGNSGSRFNILQEEDGTKSDGDMNTADDPMIGQEDNRGRNDRILKVHKGKSVRGKNQGNVGRSLVENAKMPSIGARIKRAIPRNNNDIIGVDKIAIPGGKRQKFSMALSLRSQVKFKNVKHVARQGGNLADPSIALTSLIGDPVCTSPQGDVEVFNHRPPDGSQHGLQDSESAMHDGPECVVDNAKVMNDAMSPTGDSISLSSN